MGLGLRIWIYEFGFQVLDLQDWVSGFGSIGLVLKILIFGIGSQDLDPCVWVSEFRS